MSLAKEENSSLLIAEAARSVIPDEDFSMSLPLNRRLSFRRKSMNKNANNYQASNGNPTGKKELLEIFIIFQIAITVYVFVDNLLIKACPSKSFSHPELMEMSYSKRSAESMIPTSESSATLDSLKGKEEKVEEE